MNWGWMPRTHLVNWGRARWLAAGFRRTAAAWLGVLRVANFWQNLFFSPLSPLSGVQNIWMRLCRAAPCGAAASVLLFAASVRGDALDDAQQEYLRGEYQKVIETAKSHAQEG